MDRKTPYFAVAVINLITGGMISLSKTAFNEGINLYVFFFYRQTLGAIILLPIAAVFERKTAPRLTFNTFWKIFMLGFLGQTFALNLFHFALVYTTATISSASTNSLPVLTFLCAVLLRMEKVRIKTSPGITKVIGMIVCMAGVVVLALYRGPHMKPLFHHNLVQSHEQHVHARKDWRKGCFLLLVANCCWAFWLVLQAQFLRNYPSKIMFTSLQCFSSAAQSFFVAIAMERNLSKWKLEWNIELLTIVYCGIMINVVAIYLQAWVLQKKGPVFNAMAMPLSLIFTTICSVLFLGETLSLGSTIGEILLVISLYLVLWAKSKEQKTCASKSLNEQDEESVKQKEVEEELRDDKTQIMQVAQL